METPQTSPTTISAFKRAMIFCSGADATTLAHATSSEINRYVTLGFCVLIPTVLGLFTGSYAAYFFFKNIWGAIGFGLVYAFIIFIIDRAIAAAASKSWLPLIGRLLLAIVIGLVMSFPAKLKIFEDTINEELYNQQLIGEKTVNDKYDTPRDLILKDLATREAEVQRLRNEWACEVDGTCGSGKPGRSEIADLKEQLYLEAKRQFDGYKSLKDTELSRLESDRSRGLQTMSQAQAVGLLGRVEALGRVAERSTFASVGAWVLIIIFILFEIIPMLVKLSNSGNLYERLVEAENDAKLEATRRTFQLRSEVESAVKALPLQSKLNETKIEMAKNDAQLETTRAEVYIQEILRLAKIEAKTTDQINKISTLPQAKIDSLITMVQLLSDHYGNKIYELPTLKEQLYDIINA